MDPLLLPLGYAPLRDVHGRESIADLFPGGPRVGVGVFQFESGEWLVDATIDVLARHARYRAWGLWIARVTFLALDPDALDAAERATVERLASAGLRLRDVDLDAEPGVGADFDLVVPPDAQERWLATATCVDGPTRREGRAPAGADRFADLSARREWPEVADVLDTYLRECVPAARAGEAVFWRCACLPDGPDAAVLARLHLHRREVCEVAFDNGELRFSFHLARDGFDVEHAVRALGVDATVRREVVGAEPAAATGLLRVNLHRGDELVTLVARGSRAALAILDDPDLALGLRLSNLRLLRLGLCRSGGAHSVELVEALRADEPIEYDPARGFQAGLASADRLAVDGRVDEALGVLVSRCAGCGVDLGPAEVDAVCERLEVLLPRATTDLTRSLVLPLLAAGAFERGDHDAALAWCHRLESIPGVEPAITLLAASIAARCCRDLGRPDEGRVRVEAALAAVARDPRRCPVDDLLGAWLECTRCYRALGAATGGFADDLGTWPGLRPGPFELFRCCVAIELGAAGDDPREALVTARERAAFRGLVSLSAPLSAVIAWCDEQAGDDAGALRGYEAALAATDASTDPTNRRALLAALARCAARLGRSSSAQAWSAQAESIAAWPRAAEAPWTLEELTDASLELVDELDPVDPEDRTALDRWYDGATSPEFLADLAAGGFTTYIAGTAYEGRHVWLATVTDGALLRLVREPANPYDRNAVRIQIGEAMLGYVPRVYAVSLAPLLDAGDPIAARAVVQEHPGGQRSVTARLTRG